MRVWFKDRDRQTDRGGSDNIYKHCLLQKLHEFIALSKQITWVSHLEGATNSL